MTEAMFGILQILWREGQSYPSEAQKVRLQANLDAEEDNLKRSVQQEQVKAADLKEWQQGQTWAASRTSEELDRLLAMPYSTVFGPSTKP